LNLWENFDEMAVNPLAEYRLEFLCRWRKGGLRVKVIRIVSICLVIALMLILPDSAKAESTNKLRLRHFVAIKFKDTTTPEQVHEIEEAFASLKKKIPQVVSIEWGKNISPEKLDQGYTDGFLVTFRSEKDRDSYLTNPEHLKFKEKVHPLVSEVFIIDFWGKP
jgi:hypothetical protein